MALEEKLDITKVSYHAFGYLTKKYQLLNSGSALGSGVGPLLVINKENFGGVNNLRSVAIPGQYTTANYLLGLAYPELKDKREMLFSNIEGAVLSGEVDAGLLIHENRFTYHERGLAKIADLGDFWESRTGLPIPLGGIVVRRNLPPATKQTIDRLLAASVAYAFEHPGASADYVRRHAQEMDPKVMRRHIELYVNDYTRDLGEVGRRAVAHFIEDGRAEGVIPPGRSDYLL